MWASPCDVVDITRILIHGSIKAKVVTLDVLSEIQVNAVAREDDPSIENTSNEPAILTIRNLDTLTVRCRRTGPY
jgi:hypothetical protein